MELRIGAARRPYVATYPRLLDALDDDGGRAHGQQGAHKRAVVRAGPDQEGDDGLRHRLDAFAAEQVPLGRGGHQSCQRTAVDAALLLRAVPAVSFFRGWPPGRGGVPGPGPRYPGVFLDFSLPEFP